MSDAFDRFEGRDSESGDAFDKLPIPKEPWYENLSRYASGAATGYASATPLGIASNLSNLLALGDVNDPEEMERIREISEREGIPFDEEKYMQAGQSALSSFPTPSNIARQTEEATGLPLTAKTRGQKALEFAISTTKLSPSGATLRPLNTSLPKPVLGAGVTAAKEGLQQAGLPEPLSELASFGILKMPPQGSPSISIGKSTKPSGLTERRFESVTSPTDVSKSRLDKINSTVESDFKNITDKIIQNSPVKKTYNIMKEDAGFKATIQELFPEVEALAEQISGKFSSDEVKKAIAKQYQIKESSAITPGEYDKSYGKFMRQFLKNTPSKELSAKDLVKQYRANNKELGEYFKPGESKGLNRARKDALLDYNRTLADIIESKYPDSEFGNLFKFTNKRWAEINDVQTINKFVDDLFDGKIRYDKSAKFLEKEGADFAFKRALGEEGYQNFKQLNKDLMTQQQAYKHLKMAESKGYGDLAKTGMAYLLHPKLAIAKISAETAINAAKGIYIGVLDKPQLTVVWDDGLKALKQGRYAEAESKFSTLKKSLKSSD